MALKWVPPNAIHANALVTKNKTKMKTFIAIPFAVDTTMLSTQKENAKPVKLPALKSTSEVSAFTRR
jgi:hypothetical protein